MFRFDRKRAVLPILVAAAFGLLALLTSLRSYSRSDSLILLDTKITTDEGLLTLQLPLSRLAVGEQPKTSFLTYERTPMLWRAGMRGKMPLRTWMGSLGSEANAGMIGGFGYWKGDWQSDSRPGPFIRVFAPLWAVFAALYVVFFVLYLRRWRFTIRSMLIPTAIFAAVLGLLTWHCPA